MYKDGDLLVFKKLYDSILLVWPVISRYPKHEKYVLQQSTKQELLSCLQNLVIAKKAKSKRMYLVEADSSLQNAKVLFRLAKDLKYLSVKKYADISQRLVEVGRMLGGWIKKTYEKG